MLHRSLNFKTFIASTPPVLLEQFLDQIGLPGELTSWMGMSPETLTAYFEDPEQREVRSWAYEEVHRINDLCDGQADFLVRAYVERKLPLGARETPVEMGVRLYLAYPEAFESAYSNYVLFRSSASLSSHRLPSALSVTAAGRAAFEQAVRAYYAGQAKGLDCLVVSTETEQGVILRIEHGTYLKTYPHWREQQIRFLTVRPAKEDVLLYEAATGLLHVRAALAGR